MDTNSPEFAYWAGFAAADGNMSVGGNLLFHLSIVDVEHLHRFKDYLGDLSKAKVRLGKKNDCYFSIQNDLVSGTLIKEFNVVPRKTGRLVFPTLQEDRSKAFIAGYIDGDGCFDYHTSGSKLWKYLRIQIDGNEGFLSEIKNRLPGRGLMTVRNRIGRAEHSCLRYVGRNAMEVRSFLYDENLPLLERKWSKSDFKIPRK